MGNLLLKAPISRVEPDPGIPITGSVVTGTDVGSDQHALDVYIRGDATASPTELTSIDAKLTPPLQVCPARGTLSDFSGTAGAASAQILGANSNRKYLLISNPTAADMWINFSGAATNASPSIKITGPGIFVMENGFVTTESIFAIRGAGTNVAFTGKEGS